MAKTVTFWSWWHYFSILIVSALKLFLFSLWFLFFFLLRKNVCVWGGMTPSAPRCCRPWFLKSPKNKKLLKKYFPVDIYLLKVNNRNTRARCEICSKLIIKWRRSAVFIINFKDISHLVLVFLLLTLRR